MLVVDASQSLGAAPFSIAQIKPDFLVAAAYKWLLCPYGFAVLYVSEQWRSARPLEESWLVRERAEDFANLIRYSDTYMLGARRFDGGENLRRSCPGDCARADPRGASRILWRSLAATNATTGALGATRFQSGRRSVRRMFGAVATRLQGLSSPS
jgi:hypothetical protein